MRYPLNILFCQFVISDTPGFYTHYLYSHYPHIERSAFQRENPSHNLWEREINCYTHNSLHNLLWFSWTPTSQFPNPWEVDIPNTYHTHPEGKVRFWCCWKALDHVIFYKSIGSCDFFFFFWVSSFTIVVVMFIFSVKILFMFMYSLNGLISLIDRIKLNT